MTANGRKYKVNNMGKIRKWFMNNYSEEYKGRHELKEKIKMEKQPEMNKQLAPKLSVDTSELS